MASTSVTLSSGDGLEILDGDTAISTTISNGCLAVVLPGGVAGFTIVSSGSAEFLYSGGTGISTTGGHPIPIGRTQRAPIPLTPTQHGRADGGKQRRSRHKA